MELSLTQAQLDIQERIAELPEDVASVITNGTLDATIFLIKDKYPLTTEQVTALENEIILVLTLFFLPENFVDNIQEVLNIQRPTAEAIGADINSSIFSLFDDFFELARSSEEKLSREENSLLLETSVSKKEELRNLAQTFGQPSTERLEKPNVETLTGNVEPLRTMEGDMNRIHGYGAFRETQPTQVVEAEVTSENTVTENYTNRAEKDLS